MTERAKRKKHGGSKGYDVFSVQTKVCKRCGIEKDITEYRVSYVLERDCDGLMVAYPRPYCNPCQEDIYREQWQKDKARLSSPENLAENRRKRKKKFFLYRAIRFKHGYGCVKRYKSEELALFFWHQWRRQKGLCALSGRRLTKKNAQVDHKEPRKNGINNDFDNLQWTTNDANRAKNQMTPQEFKEFITDIYNTIN